MMGMKKSSIAAFEKWKGIIQEQRTSGLGVGRFCEARGIAPSSFFPWRKKVESAAAPAFVEAKVRSGIDGVTDGVTDGSVTIEIAGGRRVSVRPGFDHDLLLEVIQMLEAVTQTQAGTHS